MHFKCLKLVSLLDNKIIKRWVLLGYFTCILVSFVIILTLELSHTFALFSAVFVSCFAFTITGGFIKNNELKNDKNILNISSDTNELKIVESPLSIYSNVSESTILSKPTNN